MYDHDRRVACMTGELFFFSLTSRLFPEGEAGLEVLILSESTLGLGE